MRIPQRAALTFSPLRREINGNEYKCTVTITSPYLNRTRSVSTTQTINVTRKLPLIKQNLLLYVLSGVRPRPISQLTATLSTPTTIALTWVVSEDVFIKKFEVVYNYTVHGCTAPMGKNMTIINDGTVMTHTLRDLSEDSTYRITVMAINDQGSTINATTTNTGTSSKCFYVIFCNVIHLCALRRQQRP